MLDALLWVLLGLMVVGIFFSILSWSASGRAGERSASVREELRLGREEASESARRLREELAASVKDATGLMSGALTGRLGDVGKNLGELSKGVQADLERVRTAVEKQLRGIQEGNEKKLDEMRGIVEGKLQETLEKRLGESFRQVSERLEAVQRGLGEMQSLAEGVGDLKKVLTNVKTRGTWGEVQLAAILEQVLTPDQYDANVCLKDGSRENVEFAVRLPGPKDDPDSQVWLPIDSKFPQEDYIRLQDASEKGDAAGVQQAADALGRQVEKSAKEISDKYLNPPVTTDFALMFMPTEGLYAEVLRIPGLIEKLQQRYRVVPAGPTTLSAILNSLRMGFRTLAIEKRASEVWDTLAAVKMEFGKFHGVLEKLRNQLGTATRTIEQAGKRTRAMERKLREVEELPATRAADMLGLEEESEPVSEEGD